MGNAFRGNSGGGARLEELYALLAFLNVLQFRREQMKIQPAESSARPAERWETVIDAGSFRDQDAFEQYWNMAYPWKKSPDEHNGSARFSPDCVRLSHGELCLTARPIDYEASQLPSFSSHPPHHPIRYRTGVIHAKERICVNTLWPRWEIKGEFRAPSEKGTWPAFWLTGLPNECWPPEIDILEFKGSNENWINTFHTPKKLHSKRVAIKSPDQWHSYRAWIELKAHNRIEVDFFIDEQWVVTHPAPSSMQDLKMALIINLQMEGSSGSPGPTQDTLFTARNVYVGRAHCA